MALPIKPQCHITASCRTEPFTSSFSHLCVNPASCSCLPLLVLSLLELMLTLFFYTAMTDSIKRLDRVKAQYDTQQYCVGLEKLCNVQLI